MRKNKKGKVEGDPKPDVGGIAHDMRSPLSVIRSFLEASRVSDDDDKSFRELHAAALRSADKLLGLVDELRRPAKKNAMEIARHDLTEIIRVSLEEVSTLAMERGIGVRYLGPKHLAVRVDGRLMGRAITNLVVNAVQASDIGSKVSVSLFTRGDVVHVEVVDSGCGIAGIHLEKIFERGFTHEKDDGTGIGLNLCRQIVQEHGGSIIVHSRKDEGAAFLISLPHALADRVGIENFTKQAQAVTVVHAGYSFRKYDSKDILPDMREDTLD